MHPGFEISITVSRNQHLNLMKNMKYEMRRSVNYSIEAIEPFRKTVNGNKVIIIIIIMVIFKCYFSGELIAIS